MIWVDFSHNSITLPGRGHWSFPHFYLLLQQVMIRITSKINSDKALFPLSFLPSLLSAGILCNEFYPLSAIIGFLIAMVAGLIYISIKVDKYRFSAGLISIPAVYWIAGGSYISFMMVMLVYELLLYLRSRRESPGSYGLKGWYLIGYLLIGAGVPLFVRQYLILQPLMMTFMSEFYYNILTGIPTAVLVLFTLPPLLLLLSYKVSVKPARTGFAISLQIALFLVVCFFGFRSFANFGAEEIMTYDFLTRNGNWDECGEICGKKAAPELSFTVHAQPFPCKDGPDWGTGCSVMTSTEQVGFFWNSIRNMLRRFWGARYFIISDL